ncbi:MAG TPA: ABC transporter permease [Candidatus Acidoferrales bacterium]|nr:ABC transporter permease [Candidatus Acidoferrales bacterium]
MGKRPRLLLREPVLIALAALRAHKLRSFLTLLGVIISVTTLIAVISIVEGLDTYIAERVANFGANTFYIHRYGLITNAKDYLEALRRNRKITMEDFEYIRERLTLAEEVGGISLSQADVRAGNEDLEDVQVGGVTPNMVNIGSGTVATGRYITESDYHRRTLVAYVGTDVTDRLFPNVDPLGKTIRINGLPFEVVGVAESNGSALGQSRDNFVNIPLTTHLKIFGEGPPDDAGFLIAVKYGSPAVREQTKDQARVLMRIRRRQKYDEKDAFGIFASESLTQLWNDIFGGIASLAIGIVSVFLVVGGIVIMNIMLASVTERTREIGIRKSLGARRRDILLQFLVEASVMSTVGGMIGVLIALLITQVVGATTSVPMRTPLGAVVLAVGVSAAVGLFFGIYPARKAATFDPITCLRAE